MEKKSDVYYIFRPKQTYRLEGGDLGGLVERWDVVDCHSSCIGRFESDIADLGNALERAIPGAEVKNCGPVVGKVLAKCTCGTGCHGGNIILWVHGNVEGILANMSRALRRVPIRLTPPTT